MADTQKSTKQADKIQFLHDQLYTFFQSEGINATLAETLTIKMLDHSATPKYKNSPHVTLVKSAFMVARILVQRAIKTVSSKVRKTKVKASA